jgi:molecular chaperone GrpE
VTEQVNEDIVTQEPQSEPAAEKTEAVEKPVDEIAALRQELDKAEAQAAEYLDGWQRARADLANARKRFEKERNEAGQLANSLLLRKVLPVLDDLERAVKTLPDDLREHSWANGVMLIQRKFQNVLDSESVKPIEVKPGDTFDPNLHEAITHEENSDHKEGEIIAEVQTGYKFGGEVLRPALVRVAK